MRIHGVQFLIDGEDFDGERFRRHLQKFYEKTEPGDMIVFPEDIGLLTAFAGVSAKTVVDAIMVLNEKLHHEIGNLAKRFPDADPRELLFSALTEIFVENFYRVFSALSSEYEVYSVACNNMAAFKGVGSEYSLASPRIYNTAFVFGTDGNELFRQNKVFLTDMEKAIGITSGDLADVRTFSIAGRRYGIAISLDAFTPGYVAKLSDSDIVLQPDANPVKWNSFLANGRWQPEEWMDSSFYISQRLERVSYVVNPMMVGRLLDLAFEGESNITKKAESSDPPMGFVGNGLSTGFHSIMPPSGFSSGREVPRDTLRGRDLSFSEGSLTISLN